MIKTSDSTGLSRPANDGNLSGITGETAGNQRRHRGKATGDLKLPLHMVNLNITMQVKFVKLRESIYMPPELSKMERIREQRRFLAKKLGVHEKLIRAMEKTHSTLPGTVLLYLTQQYSLSADYFTSEESALSERFYVEQQIREFECKLNTYGSASECCSQNSQPDTPADVTIKRSGWLKGLPRKPQTELEQRLVSIWKEVRQRGYAAADVSDLLRWAQANGISVDEHLYAMVEKNAQKKQAKQRQRRRNKNHCGWMKGLPRKPVTPEQQKLVQIWQIAQQSGKRFATVKEMMQWWESADNHTKSVTVPISE